MPDSQAENCITGEKATNPKTSIESELKKQGCTLSNWTVKKQKLNADLKCDNKDVNASGKLTGDFTSKKYDLKGDAKGLYKRVLPSSAAFNLTGEWVQGQCKKE